MATATRNGRARITSGIVDRQPTMNVDAEKCVIGSILLDPKVVDDIASTLRPVDFYDPANETIYDHAVAMHNDGGKIDATLLVERLKSANQFEAIGGMGYLATVAKSVPHAAHAV